MLVDIRKRDTLVLFCDDVRELLIQRSLSSEPVRRGAALVVCLEVGPKELVPAIPDEGAEVELRLHDVLAHVAAQAYRDDLLVGLAFGMPAAAGVLEALGSESVARELDGDMENAPAEFDLDAAVGDGRRKGRKIRYGRPLQLGLPTVVVAIEVVRIGLRVGNSKSSASLYR